MNTRLLSAGLGLILLGNAVALTGVWYNRQGEPEARLLLSERELRRGWDGPHKENSGLTLRLNWRWPPTEQDDRCSSTELSAAQLEALGFASGDTEPRWNSRPAWLVLELDGPAYQRSLRLAERQLADAGERLRQLPGDRQMQQQEQAARRALEHEREQSSRLLLVDVGADIEALRQRYPDRQRHALLPGKVQVWRCRDGANARLASIVELQNEQLNVPITWRRQLVDWLPQPYGRDPVPFSAEVLVGRRFEPWLGDVRLEEKPAAADDDDNAAR